jgi:hypothetical protein
VCEKVSLPRRRAPATYPSRWQAPPLKRQRKDGIRAEDGSVIAFPRLTHPRAGLSNAPVARTLARREGRASASMPLDRVAEILRWSPAELDPLLLSLRMQVWRVVFMIGTKALLDGKLGHEAARGRERERVLAEMARDLRDRDKA